MADKYIQIITTVEKRSDAEKMAEHLLERRLAACVQIMGPISSHYRWKGKIEKAEEWLCFIKSKKSIYHKIEKAIIKLHPYEIPEIIALPIITGSKKYLKWLNKEIGK
jgi:periplasmic divalent cation tolerance protein